MVAGIRGIAMIIDTQVTLARPSMRVGQKCAAGLMPKLLDAAKRVLAEDRAEEEEKMEAQDRLPRHQRPQLLPAGDRLGAATP